MTTKRKNEAGTALVEFAFVLPVLLVLLIGIMKCGTTFNNWITLTEAVAVGGRTLATNRLDNPNACTDATTALQNAAVVLPHGSTITPSYSFTGNGGSSCATLVAGDSGTVTATYACDLKVLWYDFKPGCTLTATITERIE
jgi:Flp pilus assembly protein TadG